MHFSIRFLVPLVFSYITFKSLLNSHIKLLFFTCCFTFCSDSAYCYSYSFKNLKKSILNLKSATFYAFCSLHFEFLTSHFLKITCNYWPSFVLITNLSFHHKYFFFLRSTNLWLQKVQQIFDDIEQFQEQM